ncbi:rIIA lysis inhibitor [Ruegeria phage RpAliso]|nr:rIIA lysis inhibitor [Ruegeria phage RpAliso]
MKTATQERNVSSNVGESGAFTIKANGKAFKVLIDGLYANKIQSITREIWSNALDAHGMAGNADRPFDVSFPSIFDPAFRVRDYGVSLTHDQVMHLYTTLFESTKEDTNDQVGKLGLGSKSPFAYTDTFTVTTWLDGKKRFYAAMIGADSIPTINYMGEEDTDEENGVEVAFPVDKQDVEAFRTAAKRVSHGFDVKPNVANDLEFGGWPELDTIMEGEGWKMLAGAIDGYRQQAYAKMGCVLYPINASAISDLTSEETQLLGHTFVIDFPVGDLEITASREELSYGRHEPTADSIRRRLKEIMKELEAVIASHFEDAPSYWEACCRLSDVIRSHGLPTFINNMFKNHATWGSEKIKTTLRYEKTERTGCYIDMLNGKRLTNKVLRHNAEYKIDVEAHRRTYILVEDMTNGKKVKRANARIKAWQEEARPHQIIWIKAHDPKGMVLEVLRVMEAFDGVEVLSVEDMEVPAKDSTYRFRRPVQVRIMDGASFDGRVDLDEEDFEEGGFYVPLERMIPVRPVGARHPFSVHQALVDLQIVRRGTPVYGAPKSLMKKFEGDQWVNLYDYAREELMKRNDGIAEKQARNKDIADVRSDVFLRYLAENVNLAEIGVSSPLQDAVTLRDMALSEPLHAIQQITELALAVNVPLVMGDDVDTSPLMDEASEIKDRVCEAYPMLGMLAERGFIDDSLVDMLTDYVNMCDNNAEQNHLEAAIAA